MPCFGDGDKDSSDSAIPHSADAVFCLDVTDIEDNAPRGEIGFVGGGLSFRGLMVLALWRMPPLDFGVETDMDFEIWLLVYLLVASRE